MKYKVSLLPEVRKKRIIGRQKLEQFRSVAVTAFIILLALFILVFVSKIFAESKLKSVISSNANYEKQVQALSKYKDINSNIENKVNLVKNIEVDEPYIYQFVVAVGNIEQPGVTITSLDCTDWKTTRQCTVTGTCNSRTEYFAFKTAAGKLDCVSSVEDVEYTSGLGSEDATSTFTVLLKAPGGKAAVDLSSDGLNLPQVSTTVVDENAGLEN